MITCQISSEYYTKTPKIYLFSGDDDYGFYWASMIQLFYETICGAEKIQIYHEVYDEIVGDS